MIIDLKLFCLKCTITQKRQNSFSTDAMAAQASKVPLQLVDESDNEWQVERSQRRAARHNAHVPRRACAARVTVVVLCVCLSVCLFICLFVSDYSRTTGYEAAYGRCQQLQCYKGKKNNLAFSLKRLRSRDMA